MASLSVLIASRNEIWLPNTIEDIKKNSRGNTNIIVVLDGTWPCEPLADDDRVILIHHSKSIGQRAAVNEAARVSQADYILKVDAHCAFDEGFDVKLLQPYEQGKLAQNVTTIPRMYNLHVFNWVCQTCGRVSYQFRTPVSCPDCKGIPHEKQLVWKPRIKKKTDFMRFDKDLIFQYWHSFKNRPEAHGTLVETMCNLGAAWMMSRERYWDIGGLDEAHGSWGQMGVEISCKSWLSGGRQIVNKRTWFSHLFRKGGDFGWPYKITDTEIERARAYSRDLWLNNKWKRAERPFSWILEHFAPVPTWE